MCSTFVLYTYDLIRRVSTQMAEEEPPIPTDLDGRVALVTGGGQGLGLTFVEVLVKNGARVSILSSGFIMGVIFNTHGARLIGLVSLRRYDVWYYL